MSDRTRAQLRTTTPHAWAALIVWALDATGATDLGSLVVPAVPIIGAVIYDFGRRLEAAGFRRAAAFILARPGAPTYPD